MVQSKKKMSFWQGVLAFYPFQLLKAHIKYNLLALFYWALLFAIATNTFGEKFGLPLLFTSPEYLGQVSSWAFFILGFSVGGFSMAFNTYSYIRLGLRFPFLATVDQPFYKFCINNSILPIVYHIVLMFQFSSFQIREEFATTGQVVFYNLSYLLGLTIFLLLSVLYFFPMNRRSEKKLSKNSSLRRRTQMVQTILPNREQIIYGPNFQNEKVFLYLGKNFRIQSSRSGSHYSKELLLAIYQKNKINATLFETLAIISFLCFGFFSELSYFEIPAASSITLLLTIILMLFSSLLSWLNRWAYPVLIGLFVVMNYLSLNSPFFTFKNYAYGLSYEKSEDYSIENISEQNNGTEKKDESKKEIISLLENWKEKTGLKKPKLILVNVSGGGSRSAMWSVVCMQNLDKAMHHKFSKHTQMITGASGGMIGSAYYREIHYRYGKTKMDPFNSIYKEKISADLLNKLSFSATTNDIFFRYRKFQVGANSYTKDRGYAFETELHENTDGFLDVNLGHYKKMELQAEIPLMIFTPTIVNDGRRMLISSQSLKFLTQSDESTKSISNSYENLDFQSFFKNNTADSIRFSSVMRASATFPFVMPMMTMPTTPQIQLMDAGIRDNYGGKITMEYIRSLQEWIAINTSGVIILQIRDTKKILDNEFYKEISLLNKLTLPFGNMYSNFTRTQDFDQEQLMFLGQTNFSFPIDFVSFNLREKSADKISLSWHLTKQEKAKINAAFFSKRNRKALNKLKKLLND